MSERKEIIQSILKDNTKSKKIKLSFLMYGVINSIGSSIIILTILSSLFKWNYQFSDWDKMQGLVIGILSLLDRFPEYLMNFMLSNHLKKIKNKTIDNDKLNTQLKIICNKIGDGIIPITLYFVIIIIATWLYEDGTYWEYFKIPVLVVNLWIIFKIINVYVKLKRNIVVFEKLDN